MAEYAISDIHGHAHTLDELLQQIGLNRDDTLFLLGDYINKGPRSKAVLDYLLGLQEDGYQTVLLKGNHEQMALSRKWIDRRTARSFQIKDGRMLPEKYRQFIRTMKSIHVRKNWIFVHAGLDFHQEDPLKVHPHMLTIRQWQHTIDYELIGQRYVLYGHTPNKRSNLLRQWERLEKERHLCIDNGCFLPHQFGFGQLCAIELGSRQLFWARNRDE